MTKSVGVFTRIENAFRKETKRRELTEYPKRRYRLILLAIVVFANIVASYEGNLAPIVPLLLPHLDITATTYGQLNAITLIVTAFVAVVSGVLADRWGRSVLVLISVLLTAVFLFLMTGVETATGFLIVKIIIGIVDGLSLAPIAGLIRDFSPQVGRGIAYAFWTLGPVGGPFIANAIASWTLPIFGTWQSQLYIMATVCIVLWIVIFLFLRDLSPELRGNVYVSDPEDDEVDDAVEEKEEGLIEVEKVGFSTIFAHPVIWLQPIGIAIFLPIYFTMTVYGPLMFTELYNVTAAEGSAITMYFWVGTIIGLIVAGWLSDKLGMRKLFALAGAIVAVLYNPFFIFFGMSPDTSIALAKLLVLLSGITIGGAYSPWMAMYSENLETINPRIQATGWGVYGLAVRAEALFVSLAAPVIVSMTGSWKTWYYVNQVAMMIYLIFPFIALGKFFPKKHEITVLEDKAQ